MNKNKFQYFNLSAVSNFTINEEFECELWNGDFFNQLGIIFTILWSLIAIFGILSNGCVLFVLLSNKKDLKVTQYFIINLAISDLLFLIICPSFSIINYNNIIIFDHLPEFLGAFICKLDYFSTHVCHI